MASVQVTEGEIDFPISTISKPCKTWYKLFGSLSSTTIPLIALHGGPGISHNYLLSLSSLASNYSIPIIFYDQIGCGKSTHLPEKNGDTDFWTVDLFLSELDNLLSKLGIREYDLYGNSWGGMLAAEHAVRQPSKLRRLIIADSPASMSDWIVAAGGLRQQLPTDVQSVLDRCERDGRTETEEYGMAVMEFYKRHVCRVWPFPGDVEDAFAGLKEDSTVYHTMYGTKPSTVPIRYPFQHSPLFPSLRHRDRLIL